MVSFAHGLWEWFGVYGLELTEFSISLYSYSKYILANKGIYWRPLCLSNISYPSQMLNLTINHNEWHLMVIL